MRLIEYGAHAVLAEYDSLDEVLDVAHRLRATPVDGVAEAVVAARTILVRFAGEPVDLGGLLEAGDATAAPEPFEALDAVAIVEIAVHYDGDDLERVATSIGVEIAEVIALHTSPTYAVAFCGFAPGFAYLVGGVDALQLPRRSTPRTRVPAGSVAVAGPFTGVYPTPSPGGWHLLGHTDAVLFDPSRRPPALLPPGTRVRFVVG